MKNTINRYILLQIVICEKYNAFDVIRSRQKIPICIDFKILLSSPYAEMYRELLCGLAKN
jgi:hypothetical protein